MGEVKAIIAPDSADYTRREIDELTEIAKRAGAKGLATVAIAGERASSRPIAKFLSDGDCRADDRIGADDRRPGSVVADQPAVVAKALTTLRDELGQRHGLADPNVLSYCWVVDFPLLEWDEESQRWDSTHNPFCGFVEEDRAKLDSDPGNDPVQAVRPGPERQ